MGFIIANNIGFCFGVKNAINKTFEIAKKTNRPIYTIGALIHNENVINELEKNNIHTIVENEISKHLNENPIYIVRTHGITHQLLLTLNIYCNKKIIEYYDLTCPFVKSIHTNLSKSTSNDTFTICFGSKTHPETIASVSYIAGEYHIVENFDDYNSLLPKIESTDKQIILFSQTTFDQNSFSLIKESLLKVKPKTLVLNTICNTTVLRQAEADNISKISDYCFVIGDSKSSNTQKLFSIAHHNCINTFYMNDVANISVIPNPNKYNIGILSGASTPQNNLDLIISELKKHIF